MAAEMTLLAEMRTSRGQDNDDQAGHDIVGIPEQARDHVWPFVELGVACFTHSCEGF
jgi:hypothetical protein